MELAELILKFIDSLKYPVIIIGFGVFFREELSGILKGDFKAKYKDLELSVERGRKTLENAKKTQEIATSKITKILNDAPQNEQSKPTIKSVSILLDSMKESFNYWESELIKALRQNKGRYPENEMLSYYFDVIEDPWRRSKDGGYLLKAISTLLEKSLVIREGVDLVLHPLLMEKDK